MTGPPTKNHDVLHRKQPPAIKWLRLGIQISSWVSHRLAATIAYQLWIASPKYQEQQREKDWRKRAKVTFAAHEYGPIPIYEWGTGPVVLLVHGWSGRGTQLGKIAIALADAGFRAIAFDAPGHGRSPGKNSTIFKCEETLRMVADSYGVTTAIVSHSFGTLVTALAIKNGLQIEKLVTLSSPTTAELLFNHFCEALKLHPKTVKHMETKFKQRFGPELWDNVSAIHNLKNFDKPTLIIHDEDDKEIPWQQSDELSDNIPNSEFILTEGLGHHRVLWRDEIISQIVSFVK